VDKGRRGICFGQPSRAGVLALSPMPLSTMFGSVRHAGRINLLVTLGMVYPATSIAFARAIDVDPDASAGGDVITYSVSMSLLAGALLSIVGYNHCVGAQQVVICCPTLCAGDQIVCAPGTCKDRPSE